MSNFFVQELVLYRHFMLIDSPIPFELVANPTNYRKDERGNVLNVDMSEITGRDICSRPAGAWRVDCWTLLPEQYHKQNPVFTMLIKYDRDLLEEGEVVDIRYSDIDIGEGVAGVNGQLVDIPASAFRPVVDAIATASASLADKFDEQNIFLSEINAASGSISDDVSTIRSDVVRVVSALSDVRNSQNTSNTILNDVKNSHDASILLLDEIKNAVLETDDGSINNKVEQIRTVLKRSATAGDSTPWGSILNRFSLKYVDVDTKASFSSLPDGLYFGVLVAGFGDRPNETYHEFMGVFVIGAHYGSRGIFSVHASCNESTVNGAVFNGTTAYLPSGTAVTLFGSGFAGVRLAF